MKFPYGPIVAICEHHEKPLSYRVMFWGAQPKATKWNNFGYIALRFQPPRGYATKQEAIAAARLVLDNPELLQSDFARASAETCRGTALGAPKFVCSIEEPIWHQHDPESAPAKKNPLGAQFDAAWGREQVRLALAKRAEGARDNTRRANSFAREAANQGKAWSHLNVDAMVKCSGHDHLIAIRNGKIQLRNHGAEAIDGAATALALGGKLTRRCLLLLIKYRKYLQDGGRSRIPGIGLNRIRFFPREIQKAVSLAWYIKNRRQSARSVSFDELARPLGDDKGKRAMRLFDSILAVMEKQADGDKPLSEALSAIRWSDASRDHPLRWIAHVLLTGRVILHGKPILAVERELPDGSLIVTTTQPETGYNKESFAHVTDDKIELIEGIESIDEVA